MWPFNKRRDEEAEAIFKLCDFELARDELVNVFRLANRDAEAEGGSVYYKEEFVAGWYAFARNPCRKTAAKWLSDVPESRSAILRYLVEACPGGKLRLMKDLLQQ